MEWVTGVKLSTLPPDEIRELLRPGQEAFLTQLLELGFFHGDPHPGGRQKPLGHSWSYLSCRIGHLQHLRFVGAQSPPVRRIGAN
jgi:ABC1 atypical kinase-like domain